MTDGPDVPGEWDPSGQAEPPAALLRRAISHVEQLLQRLERPGAAGDGGEIGATTTAIPTAQDGFADATTVEAGHGHDSGAIEPVLNNPVRRISSAAQAEALRVSLNAHEKANRLLAEASAIRAQSASEGEQILIEARDLADRMQVEASEEAALYVNRAREEAENLVSQAAAEMQRVRDAALEDADRVRADAGGAVQQLRDSAAEESERVRREAREEAEQVRSAAREEADRVRGEAAAAAAELRGSARSESDVMRSDAEQLRDSVQQEADRLLAASSEQAQRLRDDAQREAERIRSDAENQARVDREAADAAIREVLDTATADAEQIRVQAREQGRAEAADLVETQVRDAIAQARGELDAEKVLVYGLLGTANDSVAEVRSSMRELVETLGKTMGSVNGATGSIDALMTRLRDAAREGGVEIAGPPPAEIGPPADPGDTGPIPAVRDEGDTATDQIDGDSDSDSAGAEGADHVLDGERAAGSDEDEHDAEGSGDDARRPLGLLFGASHKSRASKR